MVSELSTYIVIAFPSMAETLVSSMMAGLSCTPFFNQTMPVNGNPLAVQFRVTGPPAIPACVTGWMVMTGTTANAYNKIISNCYSCHIPCTLSSTSTVATDVLLRALDTMQVYVPLS